MYDDAMLRDAVMDDVAAATVPQVNMVAIHAKMSEQGTARRRTGMWPALAAAAACAAVLLATPPAQAVVGGFEQRVDAALRAIGIVPPPPVPSPVVSKIAGTIRSGSLTEIQKSVPFTIVAPAGVPADAREVRIVRERGGEWTAKTRAWQLGDVMVMFQYERSRRRLLTLEATKYDPATRIHAYMWQPVEDAHGNVVVRGKRMELLRRNVYAWRNGDQMMRVVADSSLTDSEAMAIRTAMHGTPIREVKTKGPAAPNKFFFLPHP